MSTIRERITRLRVQRDMLLPDRIKSQQLALTKEIERLEKLSEANPSAYLEPPIKSVSLYLPQPLYDRLLDYKALYCSEKTSLSALCVDILTLFLGVEP